MTALRPERDSGYDASYENGSYEAAGTFEAAVDRLADPLNDPLPGQDASPWFRAGNLPPPQEAPVVEAERDPQEWYDPQGYQQDWYGVRAQPQPQPRPVAAPEAVPEPGAFVPVQDDETVALRTAETRRAVSPDAAPPTGGRAERRRAAKRGGRADSAAGPAAAAPRTRMEARRAARACKESPAVVASRVVGEVFISLGVLMLLFVTYQLWYTNVLAERQANGAANNLQDDWAKGRKAGAFEPGQGFAIMYIPSLDVKVPIAEGIDKHGVLDRGMVGHYAEGKLKTAMPSDKQGNFAVAGHRNTHGEPFRYINRLEPGDAIVVETQDTFYTYEMASILPQTPPSNVSVIGAVPEGSGFTGPGRYITLTTCTPEFTSTYRMIVWGKMVEERPRSKGKPDALVG
ncbi:class E sortase [Streptomyces sp. A3M-1-3]|uniref:class E sortase n=1 Tax=Streptomyces sp. A3M-1-3 TaxID=2962044 RepID=UPI0020B68A09|nr:class E sortase [Streptomyces sp. A3M-1-3]MCP3821495.1 class E sortase [Streptomyces sp. A3M-1-3]